MDTFAAPAAKQVVAKKPLPCPFTAQGMLQPSHAQPPPMFGPRGTTIPPRHLNAHKPRPSFGQRTNEAAPPTRFQARTNPFQRQRFQQRNPDTFDQGYRHHQRNNAQSGSAAPRSKELFCETCDRDFRSPDQLADHCQQHQRCGIDGCSFEAHEALISKHVQQQHNSGLYDQIKNLTTPEEIAKWREERRKRFPTKANMELRQQIREAKQRRGERLEDSTSRFGQKGDRRNAAQRSHGDAGGGGARSKESERVQNKKKRRKRKPAGNAAKLEMKEEVTDKTVKDANSKEQVENGSLVMFGGTASMQNYKRPRIVQQNALSGLLGNYGSDESESEDEIGDEVASAIHIIPKTIVDGKPSKDCSLKDDIQPQNTINQIDDDAPEEATKNVFPQQEFVTIPHEAQHQIAENDEEAPQETTVQRFADLPYPDEDRETAVRKALPPEKRQRHADQTQPIPAKKPKRTPTLDLTRRYRNQNTMLEKLLQKDIRHERNVLLQCVRYVVDSKFFGIGQPKTEKEPNETTE